jgi:hypothetical protein
MGGNKQRIREVGTQCVQSRGITKSISNPWDILGARSAELSSDWVQREEKIYDSWGDRAHRRCTVIERVARGVAERFVIGAS